jgi:hypothetical protein
MERSSSPFEPTVNQKWSVVLLTRQVASQATAYQLRTSTFRLEFGPGSTFGLLDGYLEGQLDGHQSSLVLAHLLLSPKSLEQAGSYEEEP